jgi:tetrapyrrole methylase family protein/MazG family protein
MKRYTFDDLTQIMARLRSEDGCAWDKEQTHDSIERNFVEEVYEVVDAIRSKDMGSLKEELGDVLMQVIFHSQIAKDDGNFDVNDVISMVCEKLIIRHPHVFGDSDADTPDKVIAQWDEIKGRVKGSNSHTDRLLDVPRFFPALLRACKVQHRASKAGFDWDDIKFVYEKIQEELNELKAEKDDIESELGDLLFAVVNLARFLNLDPEIALNRTTDKFIDRFSYVENRANDNGRGLEEMTLDEMDVFWEEAKKKEEGD